MEELQERIEQLEGGSSSQPAKASSQRTQAQERNSQKKDRGRSQQRGPRRKMLAWILRPKRLFDDKQCQAGGMAAKK